MQANSMPFYKPTTHRNGQTFFSEGNVEYHFKGKKVSTLCKFELMHTPGLGKQDLH